MANSPSRITFPQLSHRKRSGNVASPASSVAFNMAEAALKPPNAGLAVSQLSLKALSGLGGSTFPTAAAEKTQSLRMQFCASEGLSESRTALTRHFVTRDASPMVAFDLFFDTN